MSGDGPLPLEGVPPEDPDDAPDSPHDQPPEDPSQEWPSGQRVDENYGQAVNAGNINGGAHFHEYRDYTGEETTRRLRRATRVSQARIDDVLETFCPADARAYAAFKAELGRHHTGVITGEPGTGRAMTAIHALATLRPDVRVQEVVADPDARDAGLTGLVAKSAHSRLLDLTHLREPTHLQKAGVRALAEELREVGALLVVIARPREWESEESEHRARLRIKEPARTEDVFRRAMSRSQGSVCADRWSRDSGVRTVLEGAGPVHAIELVRTAERSTPPEPPLTEDDLSAWIERTLKAFSDATEELRDWFKRHDQETEFRRVLMEAVAVLEGASTTTVVHQAHRLAERWRVPSVWRTPISGEGLSSHLREIGAHTRADRVWFNRPGRGADALDYLWREHPDARAFLQDWSWEVAPDLDWQVRAEMARRWLDVAVRHRAPAPIESMIDQWGGKHSLMWAAVPAVAEAAVSPELGPAIRSRLYRRATSRGVSLHDRLVVEVCRVYGRVQPGTALTRLGHVADKAPQAWEESLLQALEDIAAEPGNHAVVLEELSEWAGQEEKARRAVVAGRSLTRILCQGDGRSGVLGALRSGEIGTEPVAAAWVAASSADPRVGRAVWAWCDALSGVGPADAQGAVVLLHAAGADQDFGLVLRRSVRRWRHVHEASAPVIEELWRVLETMRTEEEQ
ncbi:hypothetical protein KIK06_04425 [Nocardiopsis sp. EMB25]|uniref:hypothetical protein n=1 Tax=Nocardiopsis sp. EMB25 TaxID=2835867 RepID=UPI002283CE45|nr:hypothetical protein [Nocardiopsis sp. EMB25]MCY9783135.1 hypothetical protein [Nocardiopsis sp. EMB25]